MSKNPYERFQDNELILRDELAIDRTVLANERTMLAYSRSALSLIIVGMTFMHFTEKGMLPYIGMACIPLGVVWGTLGLLRFRKMHKSICIVRDSLKSKVSE